MQRPNRRQVLALGTSAATLALLGADKPGGLLGGKKQTPLKADETIGDLATVQSAGQIIAEGVGLVIGLDETGSDPEPSVYRQKLLNRMRQAQVPRAEQILASKSTSLVLVKAVVPIGITKEDRFDVQLELTPASTTTSLAGGYLMKTELYQVGRLKGQELEGQILGSAAGPVLAGSLADPENLRIGRVLGAARLRKDVPYSLILKENRKSARTASLVQGVVGARFFYLDGVNQKSMAEAKTDQYLTLKVPRNYHENQARFFQVLQLLPIVDTPELRAKRIEQWSQELVDPRTAGVAALKLEGLGRNAVETLRTGLASPDGNVRFFAAEALAYLNDDSGAGVLAEAAVHRAEFRAFALAALAASDQAGCVSKLRDLLAQSDQELRYGAFNALRSLDEHDAFLGKERLFEAPTTPADDDADDPMAVQIAASKPRKTAGVEPFSLYLVDCDGPPMVHVSGARRCEIVVFGRRQKLLPPVVLGGTGSVLINAGLDDESVQVARIAVGRPEQKQATSAELGSVIKTAASLGAGYPEIVSLLRDADRQKNLEGPLVLDAVPTPTPDYERAQLAGEPAGKDKGKSGGTKDPAVGQASFEPAADRDKEKDKGTRRRLFERIRPGRKSGSDTER